MTRLPEPRFGPSRNGDRLTPLLATPAESVEWGAEDWDRAIRQARRAGLLARLEARLAEAGLIAHIPPAPRAHLEAARILASKHRDDVGREIRAIAAALETLDAPLVLLKGAAYASGGPAAGRGAGCSATSTSWCRRRRWAKPSVC